MTYPYRSEPGNVLVLGPECFQSAFGAVICYQGVNYYRSATSAAITAVLKEEKPVTEYQSDVQLSQRYRDEQTGFEGVATSITFFQHACERVALEAYDPNRKEVKIEIFDSPRLVSADTGERADSSRPGGPGAPNAQRGSLSR